MVKVETSQLTDRCTAWRDALRNYREVLTNNKNQLQENAGQSLSRDQLREVEQLHNQFHIQLINIHDLKHAIKTHERGIAQDLSARSGQIRRETIANHESLHTEYVNLENTLHSLQERFDRFLKPA